MDDVLMGFELKSVLYRISDIATTVKSVRSMNKLGFEVLGFIGGR